MPDAQPSPAVPHRTAPHARRGLPLRVGTRGSPLARIQTRMFLGLLGRFCPVLAPGFNDHDVFEEHVIRTTGDQVQDRSLAEIGGKGLFSKEIHEQLLDGRIDFACHSLKDLETELPPGIVLACTLRREDARDALICGPDCGDPVPGDAFAPLPAGAMIGTTSLRRQAQLLHARPDLGITLMRGNVQTRLAKVKAGDCAASLLAVAGLRRLGMATGYRAARSGRDGAGGGAGHHRDHGAGGGYGAAGTAGGDRGSGSAGRVDSGAGVAGGAGRVVPDPDRRARAAAVGRAAASDRAGGAGEWELPAEAKPAWPGG